MCDLLCIPLFLKLPSLSKIFKSVVFSSSYDGVYATSEQRVGGGGSLDLPKVVAEELGIEEGSLTGTWDYSHSLQIIWNNGLKKHTTVEDLINLVFSAMDEYRTEQYSEQRLRSSDF